jgi:hypothetical protein
MLHATLELLSKTGSGGCKRVITESYEGRVCEL